MTLHALPFDKTKALLVLVHLNYADKMSATAQRDEVIAALFLLPKPMEQRDSLTSGDYDTILYKERSPFPSFLMRDRQLRYCC